MNIGDRIKKRRKELDLTQQELALAVGYSDRSMIAKIEANAVDLPTSKIDAFAERLHTTSTYLLGLDIEARQEDLMEKINSLQNELQCVDDADKREKIESEIAVLSEEYTDLKLGTDLSHTGKTPYYLDPETAEIAQEVYDRPELKILFDASRKASKEDIQFVVEMIDRMAKKERGED